MIIINNKSLCSGCTACLAVCPKDCISMRKDTDGFKYPKVDLLKCIDCGRCEKVCPFIHQWDPIDGRSSLFAMQSLDPNAIEETSSGGVFSGIAKMTLDNKGIVYGVAYNRDWNAYHRRITLKSDLPSIQGSKYIQSDIGNTFRNVLTDLLQGEKVLFSGTPCQVAGLKHFLRKDYSKLTCIEVVCHGVPSPKAWQAYLHELSFTPSNVNMRKHSNEEGYYLFLEGTDDKQKTHIVCEHLSKNIYLRGFLANLYLRPSCFKCMAKNFRSHADITLGDFWTINKFSNKWKKTPELVLANTMNGLEIIEQLKDYRIEPIKYGTISQIGNYIQKSASSNVKTTIFFDKVGKDSFSQLVESLLKKTYAERLIGSMKDGLFYLMIAVRDYLNILHEKFKK